MKNLQKELAAIDEQIKASALSEARESLKLLCEHKIERKFITELANLLRRSQLPKVALKILKPYVHPRSRHYLTPTNSEKSEYAASLISMRLTNEALHLLSQITNPFEYPKTLLIESSAYQAKWDYINCYKTLQFMINSKSEIFSEHDIIIAKVNFADCLLHLNNFPAAIKLLEELCHTTMNKSLFFTHGKCLEIMSRIYLYQGQFSKAEIAIKKALTFYHDKNSFEHFLARKQLLIIKWHKDTKANTKIKSKKFHSLCTESINKNYHESLRDLWIEWSKINKRDDVMNFIMTGSPYEGIKNFFNFQASLKPEDKFTFIILSQFPFELSNDKNRLTNYNIENIYNSSLSQKKIYGLKATKSIITLLKSLSNDFFRPKSIYDIINDQKNDHHKAFNISTINLAHQNILRLRRWIKQHQLPISLICKNKSYYLKANRNFGSISLEISKKEEFVDILRNTFSDKPFKKADIVNAIANYSPRTINRELEQILKNTDLLVRHGRFKNTYYQFRYFLNHGSKVNPKGARKVHAPY